EGPRFLTRITVPVAQVGALEVRVLARDTTGTVRLSAPITLEVGAPGATLLHLVADPLVLMNETPMLPLTVRGAYSDGIDRDLREGVLYEIDEPDPAVPSYPYNGSGIASVDDSGMVTAKARGSTLCHVTFGNVTTDVVVEVAEIRPVLRVWKPGFVSW